MVEHLGAFQSLQALASRQTRDPMEVVEDQAQRALLAEALLAEVKPPDASEVRGAIQQIQEHAMETRQRELRVLIAEKLNDAEIFADIGPPHPAKARSRSRSPAAAPK